jgi:hypothetical protein
MSILIKGMEMPKSCCACPLFKSNMSKQLFCKAFGAFDKSDYDKLPIERMKNCPLVPVPEHGDLIDRDALLDTATIHWSQTTNESCFPIDEIEYAPTIIPEEEGE